MKKTIAIIACVLMVLSLFAGCAAKKEAVDPLQKVKDAGTLVIGLDDAYPPYGFTDTDGVIKGFDIDLATEACKRLGVELKCQPINWDYKTAELDNGNIDCIWNGFTITDEMSAKVLFTEPYVNNRQVIAVRKDSGITNKAGLAGKSVGVQAGSSANGAIDADEATKKTFKELVSMKDNVLGLTEVKNKTVDALVLDEAVAASYISDNPDLIVLEEDFGAEQYGIGFRLTDKTLMEAVQSTLAEMRADGTIAAIAAKWPDVTGAITK